MNEVVEGIIQVSPPLSLMLCINFLMLFAARTPYIPNWSIPWLCIFIGMIVYPLISETGKVGFAVRYPIAAQIMTGFLLGGAAVGSHQLFRQTVERWGIKFGSERDSDPPVVKE